MGLRPLNARVGLMRREFSAGSASFSTLITGSPTSTASSDLDTEVSILLHVTFGWKMFMSIVTMTSL